MPSAVANRYARALVDIVTAPDSPLKPEEAVSQLHAIDEMIGGSEELRIALLTPAISNARKCAVISGLLEKISVSPLIRNVLYVIINHRRVSLIGDVRQAFESAVDERLGFVRAEVSSAAALDARRSAALEAELSRLTGKRMRLRFNVDSGLLGGLMARIGSTVYDGSVRGQLQKLRRQLTEQSAE